MYNISGSKDLKVAIRLLEEDLEEQESRLSEHFGGVVENLRPAAIVKDLLGEVMSSEELRNNILNTTLGVSAGYVTKKLFFGKDKGLFAALFGYLIELGAVYLITHPPENLKEILSGLLKLILKKDEAEEPVSV